MSDSFGQSLDPGGGIGVRVLQVGASIYPHTSVPGVKRIQKHKKLVSFKIRQTEKIGKLVTHHCHDSR